MPRSIQVFTLDGTPQKISFNKKDVARLAYRPRQGRLMLYLLDGSIYYIQGDEALAWYEKLTVSSKK